jgi:sugar lactone lactonase YvrE
MKRHLLITTLIGILMAAFVPCAYADLYIGNIFSHEILRYNEVTGEFIQVFVRSDNNGGLSSPRSLLFGRDGNLYVTSFSSNSVMRYSGTAGEPLPAPGLTGAFFVPESSGGLSSAAGMILGPDNNLYVGSQGNDSVLRYSGTTGDFLDAFIPTGFGGLSNPRGMVFGPDGNLYVNSYGTNSVLRYDGTTGAFLGTFASDDALAQNNSCVFGPDGNMYVSNSAASSILRFNGATGEFIDTFVPPNGGGLNFPTGMIFGPDNNLYVSSTLTSSVMRYDGTTGAFIDAFIPGGLSPVGLFFTNTDPTTLGYLPPKSRLLITAPATAVSGTPFDITVTALDASGNIDTSYDGTVSFSATDPDSGVLLPADYTFTTVVGGDNGVHTFSGGVTLLTLGAQTLSVRDTVSGITGRADVTVGPAP